MTAPLPRCESRSPLGRHPCDLEQGHPGSHQHHSGLEAGWYWTDLGRAIPAPQPVREELEKA